MLSTPTKPSLRNFEALLKAVPSKQRHLHVAQSLFHDHVPAQAIGLHSVWINRYGQDQGAVLQANGTLASEPRMNAEHVAQAVLYMASLPLEANVQFMTVMATRMPFIGRG